MWSSDLLPLTISSYDADPSIIPHPPLGAPHLNKAAEPSITTLHWKSTISATAKLLLCGVRDSADAFGPLKSVAGGLCFIMENHKV